MNDWYKNAFWFLFGGTTIFTVLFIITVVAVTVNPDAFR